MRFGMKRFFPLVKSNITLNPSFDYLLSYKYSTEIPIYPHPGSFGFIRKNHIHEGIDLYAEDGDEVIAMEDGIILSIIPFTGEIAGSPWWNNTYSIFVKHKDFIVNYGEITPLSSLKEGDAVKAGDIIGNIKTVLLKDKGRPMSMLHLEMYSLDAVKPITEWSLNTEKHVTLMDPTPYIIELARKY